MIEIPGLEKVVLKEDGSAETEDTTFVTEKGVLSLIDFWVSNEIISKATWCAPC